MPSPRRGSALHLPQARRRGLPCSAGKLAPCEVCVGTSAPFSCPRARDPASRGPALVQVQMAAAWVSLPSREGTGLWPLMVTGDQMTGAVTLLSPLWVSVCPKH